MKQKFEIIDGKCVIPEGVTEPINGQMYTQ